MWTAFDQKAVHDAPPSPPLAGTARASGQTPGLEGGPDEDDSQRSVTQNGPPVPCPEGRFATFSSDFPTFRLSDFPSFRPSVLVHLPTFRPSDRLTAAPSTASHTSPS